MAGPSPAAVRAVTLQVVRGCRLRRCFDPEAWRSASAPNRPRDSPTRLVRRRPAEAAAPPGRGGADRGWRSIQMNLAKMVGHVFRGNVPAAVVARRHIMVTIRTKQFPTVQELLHAGLILFGKVGDISRNRELSAALVTLADVILGDHRGVMYVQAARHRPAPLAERAGHPQLGNNGLANEGALILKLVQE